MNDFLKEKSVIYRNQKKGGCMKLNKDEILNILKRKKKVIIKVRSLDDDLEFYITNFYLKVIRELDKDFFKRFLECNEFFIDSNYPARAV
ncbi:MAG: hypothetical protein KatS3mg068_1545 [Candidatus Sericytochromatia bacterium]|nr:MAG: hypothetical protein KatS3mg068_1545 [Candidatus Sericytochromatia bacterium]